jgi:nucleotide-binding universal stress UspA family protein
MWATRDPVHADSTMSEPISADPRSADARPRPIVVGYDGSPASARALERAATLAGTDGRVVVVTARPSAVPSAVTRDPILDGPSASAQRHLLEASRELLQRHRTNATFLAMASDPAEALARVARGQLAELIVVGQTGAGYVTRALLGSTAENVVRQAPCDVLVVA